MCAAALAVGAIVAIAGPTQAEIIQEKGLRVEFDGEVTPNHLPRTGLAPVAVTLAGRISSASHSHPPQLRRISVAINRHGRLDAGGLPRCRYHQIQPASTREAREACRDSLVGTGSFKANVVLPDQSPFPSNGRLLAFNGILHGQPVIYAHIYGTKPLPLSQLIIFRIHRISGTYRVVLRAVLPEVAAEWGYVSGLNLTLKRTYRYRGRIRSYLSAGCPAPAGFRGAIYPMARASFTFAEGATLRAKVLRECVATD